MWKAAEAAGVVALSTIVTIAVVSAIMPAHHASERRSGPDTWALQRAVLDGTVNVRPAYAVTAAAASEPAAGALAVCPYAGRTPAETVCPFPANQRSAGPGLDARSAASRCPVLAARAAAPACPYLAATASSSCPYLAGRATGDGCPWLKGQRGQGAEGGCPYLEGREGMSETPKACPRGGDREPSLPASGPEKPLYPQLASVDEGAAGGSELS